ncbi:MAG: YraN family protein [Mycobacteriales bacterium]
MELGRWGEQLAVEHLARDGITLLARNWRCQVGELDIVGREGDTIVFCEVKTRRATRFGAPVEAITRAKAARLRRLAGCWLAEHAPGSSAVRLDVLAVLAAPGQPVRLEHLRGIG